MKPLIAFRLVMAQLDAKLATDVRETLAVVFRELLMNAIEWGGQLDPNRTVRIACLRTQRMLMYRIADPGPGFSARRSAARGRRAVVRRSDRAHGGP